MNKQTEVLKALKAIGDAIVEIVKAAGPLGMPSGHLYAQLMTHGCSIQQYEQIMAALCQAGLLKKRGECYTVPQ